MQIDVLLLKLAKPAQRAVQSAGLATLEQLSNFSEEELLEFHGIGKNAVNIIKRTLDANGMSLKNSTEKENG
jgi:DNA-directed RNA polymerase alpha subunit